MPTLTITKNYDDGTVLTESQLDDIKTSIETFINTTKLDNANIQTGGLATANYATGSVDTAALASNAVTTVKITDSNVTTAKIADSNVTTAKIASGAVTTAKLDNNLNLPGKASKVNNNMIVVANTNPSTSGLSVIRGLINSSGAVAHGEGFTSVRNSVGDYTITYSTAFADTATAVAVPENPGAYAPYAYVILGGANSFTVRTWDALSATQIDTAVSFIVCGQRA